jgi:hypothetical protein
MIVGYRVIYLSSLVYQNIILNVYKFSLSNFSLIKPPSHNYFFAMLVY